MGKGRFNKILSQLECVNRIADPVAVKTDPTYISDFIHYVFENKEQYGLENTSLNHEWFAEFSEMNKEPATKMIGKLLENNGHVVSKKSIMEGIELFNQGFEDVR